MSIQRVGVVGAGVIGRGVCHALAAHGLDVLLVDIDSEALRAAHEEIRRNARMYRLFGEGTDDWAMLSARIHGSTDYDSLGAADFVIENISEDWDAKVRVHRLIDRICAPSVVVAVNTSVIPISRIAAETDRPDRLIGLHFMNPVPLKPVVEMIRGQLTSDATVDRAQALLRRMDKDHVLVADSPGFVTNRVLMLAVNEAAYLVHEGVAEPAHIDRLFTGGFGHRMGILETADLIGLDTVLNSIELLHREFGGDKYRPCPLLRQLVDAGSLGRKNGRGFYEYHNA